MVSPLRRQLANAVRKLRSQLGVSPELAIVFGSGLGQSFTKRGRVVRRLPFKAIPHFVTPGVAGHRGEILLLELPGKRKSTLLVVKGRVHLYEGHDPQKVVFPIRALALWGVSKLILSNASGSLNPRFRTGDLALIRDHINFTGINPLVGPNLDFLGPRFLSLQYAYQNPLSEKIQAVARKIRIPLKKAVYVGVRGPSFETDAEIKAFRKWGGDLVGMSTVLEVIAAVHAGMQIAAVAAVTNSCLHRKSPLNHREVLENARKIDERLAKLLIKVL